MLMLQQQLKLQLLQRQLWKLSSCSAGQLQYSLKMHRLSYLSCVSCCTGECGLQFAASDAEHVAAWHEAMHS